MQRATVFEWDEAKNQANVRKHGVSFETARRIFDGPVLTWPDNRRDYSEDRYVSIGQVAAALIVVAHTDREGHSPDLGPSGVTQGKAGLS